MKSSHFLLLILTLLLTPLAQAGLKLGEFRALSPEKQIRILKAYREFFSAFPGELGVNEPRKTVFIQFISEAYAIDENFDCFYAGWPSKKVAVSSTRSLCTSPQRGNSTYSNGDCGANSLHCNPLLFGGGLCAQTSTQKLRNSAFSQCEQAFKASGRSDADVVKQFSDPELNQETQDLFATVDRVCNQKNAPSICKSLERRIEEIMAQVESEVAEEPSEESQEPKEEENKPENLLALTNGLYDLSAGTPAVGDVACVDEKNPALPISEPQVASPPSRETASAGSLKSISDVLEAIKSDPLKFVGRDYPAGSLGAGGNLNCVFENSKVYVELNGCRPTSSQKMSAFMATVYFKDGSIAYLNLDNENDPYPLAKPLDSRGWKFNAYEADPLPSNLSFMQVSEKMRSSAQDYSKPGCYFSRNFRYCVGDQFDQRPCTKGQTYLVEDVSCRNGADNQKSYLENNWRSPRMQLEHIHSALLAVPR